MSGEVPKVINRRVLWDDERYSKLLPSQRVKYPPLEKVEDQQKALELQKKPAGSLRHTLKQLLSGVTKIIPQRTH